MHSTLSFLPRFLQLPPGVNRQLNCKVLHVATVDSLLSPARITLDIPPSCYFSDRSVRKSISNHPLVTFQASNAGDYLKSPKIPACPTLQRSTISTLWATNSRRHRPIHPAASSTWPTCASSPPPWATR